MSIRMSERILPSAVLVLTLVFGANAASAQAPATAAVSPSTSAGVLDHRYRPLAGREPVDLARRYGGQVLLVVNTASKCGFTPQFEALEALHTRFQGRGFAVLGFPSGDFREQEFEDEQAIQEFCTLTYGVNFPMFEKVQVVGAQATPLYRQLTEATGQAPQWNFHKYLVGRDGRVLAQWGSRTLPDDPEIVAAIQRALAAPRPDGRALKRP
ncbi:glutathione peroxidase [Luteimonas deserti]|nr:glutathione peroxidase [Luteimonas deserti]